MTPRAVKNWMSNRKNCRRSYEMPKDCYFISKEAEESIKESLQHQLQEVEKGRHDLMPEHQKAQKESQRIQSIQDKRRNMQKENAAAQEEMRKMSEENDRNEERFLQLSNKVDKNKMADAGLATDLQSLHAGEQRRGSNVSQTCDCCLEEMLQRAIALGTNGVDVLFQKVRREMGAAQGQMLGREEGRMNNEQLR